jgi:zinc/manganese transport system substrate-binding protein
LSPIPPEARKIVTNHEASGYFADRYGFEIIGTVIPGGSTLAEPSAADIADLVNELREEGVTAIFAENTNPTVLAETVAAELGSEVEVFELYSDSLGEPGSGADTYIGMIRSNAETVATALG